MTQSTPTGWTKQDKKIVKKYAFKSFNDAMRFMADIALFCDQTDHHPEWKNIYNQIWVELTTHDAGDVTEKDIALANHMDGVFSNY
jgi:4a-hydroxytetrahydrobiopterin dehydratase